jgi:hypothetical protein
LEIAVHHCLTISTRTGTMAVFRSMHLPRYPDELQARKTAGDGFGHQVRAIAILDVGRMHARGQQPALRVHQDMAFAALYFLATVVPA